MQSERQRRVAADSFFCLFMKYLLILLYFCGIVLAYQVDRAWVQAKAPPSSAVTLCTHMTLDRWDVLLRQIDLWNGTVSAILYIKGNESSTRLDQIKEKAEKMGDLTISLIRAFSPQV